LSFSIIFYHSFISFNYHFHHFSNSLIFILGYFGFANYDLLDLDLNLSLIELVLQESHRIYFSFQTFLLRFSLYAIVLLFIYQVYNHYRFVIFGAYQFMIDYQVHAIISFLSRDYDIHSQMMIDVNVSFYAI